MEKVLNCWRLVFFWGVGGWSLLLFVYFVFSFLCLLLVFFWCVVITPHKIYHTSVLQSQWYRDSSFTPWLGVEHDVTMLGSVDYLRNSRPSSDQGWWKPIGFPYKASYQTLECPLKKVRLKQSFPESSPPHQLQGYRGCKQESLLMEEMQLLR